MYIFVHVIEYTCQESWNRSVERGTVRVIFFLFILLVLFCYVVEYQVHKGTTGIVSALFSIQVRYRFSAVSD